MPRLIDDLRAASAVDTPWWIAEHLRERWSGHARNLLHVVTMAEFPVLLIDNVADYYYRGTDQEYWDIGRDFPNIAPPYQMFWTEHKLPHTIRSGEFGDTPCDYIGKDARLGTFWCAVARDDWPVPIPEEVRWVLTAEMFIDYDFRGKLIEGPTGTSALMVTPEGALIGKPMMRCYSGGEHAEVLKSFITWLHPALLAISFLHCRNVRIVDNEAPKPLAKKFHGRTGIWPRPWHTLEIDPLKQILRKEGNAQTVGLAKAMHICRGHFKDYREGRGLFGKYHQIVWQPSVIRGTKGKEAAPREVRIKL
jgi:hypothetical protein